MERFRDVRKRQAAWLAATLGVLLLLPELRRIPHVCLMQALLHRPCPGCGVTTGLLALLHGRLGQALRANPASLFVLLALGRQAAAHAAALGRARQAAAALERVRPAVTLSCSMGLGAVWVLRLSGRL